MRSIVLAVDPAPTVHRFLRTFLATEPVEILSANDGTTAMKTMEDRRVDLVLVALTLPDMSGFDVCRRIKDNPCTAAVPVMILAENASRTEKVRGLQEGAADFLAKPIDPSELLARLRAALRSRQMQRELEQQNSMLYQLHEFSLRLNAMETVEDTLRAALICALSLTYSGRGCILVPDRRAAGRLLVAHMEGVRNRETTELAMRIGAPVSGHVFAGNGLRVVNTIEDLGNEHAEDVAFLGGPPFISLALPSQRGPLGVLNVAGKLMESHYSDQDIRILRCVAATAGVAVESQQRRLRLDQTRDAALLGLAGLAEWRDPETGAHLERLCGYAQLLAEGLAQTRKYARTIDRAFLEALSRSVPMHDIGKVAVPDNVLLKPGKLTEAEFDIMKTHTEVGAKVLRSMAERAGRDLFLDMAYEIAMHHHERYDGTGYPTGLAGEAIPLAARITAVADVYDALVTDRVYRKAWPHEKAVSYIRQNAGSHFDPDVVAVFLERADAFLRLQRNLAQAGLPENKPEEAAVAILT
ncbi:MAG: HD domain-containing phosphohydrolase [Phycisphaerae bacterium]